jgi:hypothetical protein
MQNSPNIYRDWLGIREDQLPPDHYTLLGLPRFEPDPTAIDEAAKDRMRAVRPRCLKFPELGTQLLNEIAVASVCLKDPQRKADYDAWLCVSEKNDLPEPEMPGHPATSAILSSRELTERTKTLAPIEAINPRIQKQVAPPSAPPPAAKATATTSAAVRDGSSQSAKWPKWSLAAAAALVAIIVGGRMLLNIPSLPPTHTKAEYFQADSKTGVFEHPPDIATNESPASPPLETPPESAVSTASTEATTSNSELPVNASLNGPDKFRLSEDKWLQLRSGFVQDRMTRVELAGTITDVSIDLFQIEFQLQMVNERVRMGTAHNPVLAKFLETALARREVPTEVTVEVLTFRGNSPYTVAQLLWIEPMGRKDQRILALPRQPNGFASSGLELPGVPSARDRMTLGGLSRSRTPGASPEGAGNFELGESDRQAAERLLRPPNSNGALSYGNWAQGMMQRFDKNQDRLLSSSEQPPGMPVKDMDMNGDGAIDLTELTAYRARSNAGSPLSSSRNNGRGDAPTATSEADPVLSTNFGLDTAIRRSGEKLAKIRKRLASYRNDRIELTGTMSSSKKTYRKVSFVLQFETRNTKVTVNSDYDKGLAEFVEELARAKGPATVNVIVADSRTEMQLVWVEPFGQSARRITVDDDASNSGFLSRRPTQK